MKNFEEAIAPYTTKIVDDNNPGVYKYQYNLRKKVMSINIHDPSSVDRAMNSTKNGRRPVSTPLGRFSTMSEAAKAHEIAVTTMFYRLQTGMEGYNYE